MLDAQSFGKINTYMLNLRKLLALVISDHIVP